MRQWLALVGAATLILGASYTMVQQSTRLAANDQPISLAQTLTAQLDSGATPNDVVSLQSINLRSNNNAFAIVTDTQQHILAGSAILDGQSPLPPKGVFNYMKSHSSDTFTWQPAGGVRLATYIIAYAGPTGAGYIVTGQSLSEPEKRIDTYTKLALAAWIAVIAWASLTLLLPEKKFFKN